jgi:hypothetical protein
MPVNHPWLVAYYVNRRYHPVESTHNPGKTYDSIVLEKDLAPVTIAP